MREGIQLEMAPMEGLTGYVFRNALAKDFPGADVYYTPFLVVNQHHTFKRRERRDVDPRNQIGLSATGKPRLVPQLMASDPDLFLWGCQYLSDLGYEEVNLNAGCPSPTVTAKGKGCGMLEDTLKLNRFFDRVFEGLERQRIPVRISVKTRLGMEDAGEMEDLMRVYTMYPIARLMIHARVGRAAYSGMPDQDSFCKALEKNNLPVSYNGDILTPEDGEKILVRAEGHDLQKHFNGLMLGRGVLRDPALFRKVRGGPPADRAELENFVGELFEGYAQAMDGYGNALLRMKELWSYLAAHFSEGDRYLKKIRKSRQREDYEQAVRELFRSG
ncbi:tRNA dihydrouridine synthase [Shuttleworthella satelles]|nr:tRNA-dihydrouridine synthase family protein [Shuttleworthia satelles]